QNLTVWPPEVLSANSVALTASLPDVIGTGTVETGSLTVVPSGDQYSRRCPVGCSVMRYDRWSPSSTQRPTMPRWVPSAQLSSSSSALRSRSPVACMRGVIGALAYAPSPDRYSAG